MDRLQKLKKERELEDKCENLLSGLDNVISKFSTSKNRFNTRYQHAPLMRSLSQIHGVSVSPSLSPEPTRNISVHERPVANFSSLSPPSNYDRSQHSPQRYLQCSPDRLAQTEGSQRVVQLILAHAAPPDPHRISRPHPEPPRQGDRVPAGQGRRCAAIEQLVAAEK